MKTKGVKEQVLLQIEQLEERIAPDTVGALHNNPTNPSNNNDHNAVPKGALPAASSTVLPDRGDCRPHEDVTSAPVHGVRMER